MREILLRGKRKDNGEWVRGGSVIHFLDGEEHGLFMPQFNDTCETPYDPETGNLYGINDCMFYQVDPETVGQYTGWHDKHGAMIFEDDIVFFPGDFKLDKGFFGRVVFRDGQWQIIWWNAPAYVQDLYTWTKRSEIAVVGNIYDNPELIGGK